MFTVYITMSNGVLNVFEGQDFEQVEELRKKYSARALDISIVDNTQDSSDFPMNMLLTHP